MEKAEVMSEPQVILRAVNQRAVKGPSEKGSDYRTVAAIT